MVKFVLFLKKIYVLLVFVFLEILAVNYYAGSTSYTRAKLLTASNVVVGGIYKQFASVGEYFSLKRQNTLLTDRIAVLMAEMEELRAQVSENVEPYLLDAELARYVYTSARVINNTITKPENFITLDKGRGDGVEPNMAIITPEGTIVGYVMSVSDRFAVGISVLNTNFRTGGKIKGRDYFGSVSWPARSHTTVTLSEIPKYADLGVGDTIVTDYSSIFPTDVVIGTVEGFELNRSGYYDVDVRLATPISSITNVLLVRYSDIVERMMLEEETIHETSR